MHKAFALYAPVIAVCAPLSAMAQPANLARPELVLRQIVEAMPRAERQEVRVMTATFKPGDRTVYHTHRFPVTVYVLEGALADGQPIPAGRRQAW